MNWVPTKEIIAQSNLKYLMDFIRCHATRDQNSACTFLTASSVAPSVQELHSWSVKNFQAFWEYSIERLGIVFQEPYKKICNLDKGIENVEWLPGARFNIVDSCFKKENYDSLAIIESFREERITFTYEELETYVNRFAQGLVRHGLKKGDAIAICMPMTWHSVVAYLGIIKVGGIVVSIADSFSAHEMNVRFEITKPKVVLTMDYLYRGDKTYALYEKLQKTSIPCILVITTDRETKLRPQDLAWDHLLNNYASVTSYAATSDDIINILFSSGTTGEPKAIPWTHATPIKCATDAHWHHDLHPGDRFTWPTNLGWMMGPWLIFATLINKATMTLYCDIPTDKKFGEFIQNEEVTHLGLVPSLVKAWRASKCMEELNWQKIKLLSSTGECSNASDMTYLMSLAGNKPIIEYCGGTEIGGGYITSTIIEPNIAAAFSTPALGLDFDIRDEEGNIATNGEVFITTPSLGLSQKLLNRDHHEVYFEGTPAPHLRRHGDQIEKLQNGYFRVQGRVDDTMNLGGIKVSSAEIERACGGIQEIKDIAAIAIPPIEGGPSELVLYIVPRNELGKTFFLQKSQDAIRNNLNPLFKVSDVVLIEALPRTASNKIMRRELRRNYGLVKDDF